MTGPRKPWLRLWDRSLDLPKAQRLTGDQFKAWINLLMVANRQDENGKLPAIEDVAFALRVAVDEAQGLVSALVSAKLIDKRGSVLSMHDWESWQPAEKTSAQRSAEWREDQKNKALAERSESALANECERSEPARDAHADMIAIAQSPATSIVCNGTGIEDSPRKRVKKVTPSIFLGGRPWDVPEQDWIDYHAVRKHKRALDNDGSLNHVLSQIEKLRHDGQNIAESVRQSIRSNWTDVYPVKPNGTHKPEGEKKSPPEPSPREIEILHEQRRANELRLKTEREQQTRKP